MHTMDEAVGMLLKRLDELKLTEHTIVIFTSDNGGLHVPELKDDPPTHNTPFRAGKGFLYEGGLRVPAIVRWPKIIEKGHVSKTTITQTDWLPTILEACGLKTDGNLDGVSVLDGLKGKPVVERPLIWHFPHYTNQGSKPAGAYRRGKWKLIEHYDVEAIELYDLDADPGEENNLAKSHAEQAQLMSERLHLAQETGKFAMNQPNPKFEAGLYKKLYEEVDVSKLKPAKTAAEMTPKLKAWRETMDAVVPRKQPKK
jgi:arylsulfatase A-like enzyme